MQIYYPIKSNNGDAIELKYSLRSVQQFYPDAEIIICGELPKWAKNITHFPYPEKQGNRGGLNTFLKLELISKRIKGDFLHMNDDIFLLKPFNYLANNLCDGDLKDRVKSIGESNYYKSRLLNTIELLQGFGKSTNYDIHQPIAINSIVVEWICKHFNFKQNAYLYKSLIANMTNDKVDVSHPHAKITNPSHLNDTWVYFSVNDSYMHSGGLSQLQSLFPHKSKWEL